MNAFLVRADTAVQTYLQSLFVIDGVNGALCIVIVPIRRRRAFMAACALAGIVLIASITVTQSAPKLEVRQGMILKVRADTARLKAAVG